MECNECRVAIDADISWPSLGKVSMCSCFLSLLELNLSGFQVSIATYDAIERFYMYVCIGIRLVHGENEQSYSEMLRLVLKW